LGANVADEGILVLNLLSLCVKLWPYAIFSFASSMEEMSQLHGALERHRGGI
jgi:hypothetical protein